MKQNESNLRASLLDRLVDQKPGISHEPVPYRLLNIRQIKALDTEINWTSQDRED